MLLSRLFLVPLLFAGTLPCLAQSAPAKQSPSIIPVPSNPQFVPFSSFVNPPFRSWAKTPSIAHMPKSESSKSNRGACYSMRDYQFATPKGSGIPILKSYSTCESASLFHMAEVTVSPRQSHP